MTQLFVDNIKHKSIQNFNYFTVSKFNDMIFLLIIIGVTAKVEIS